MNQRRLFSLGVASLALALPVTGCGDYADPKDASGGGAGMAGTGPAGSSGAGGSTAGTGAAGQAGTTTTGGSSGAGQGGSAGTAGSSGQAGGGTAGTAGSAGTGAESGTAGAAGTAGSGGGAPLPCPEPVPDATPCGGDVVGTWNVAMCPLAISGELDMMGFGLGCPSATVTSGSLQVTGTMTFNMDGTYADATTTTGEQVVELPETCLHVSGTVTACDRVGGPVRDSLGYVAFDCVDNTETGGCTCQATIEQEGGLALIGLDPFTEGSYMTMDTSLSLEGEDADTEYSYCVSEDTLVASFVTVGKVGTVEGPIVFKK